MAGTRRRTGPTASGRWRRWTLLTPLLAILSLVLTAPASTALVSAAPTKAQPRPVTTSYENPLAPVVPGDGTVDSCADPMVIQGQDGETIDGEQVWYMYCTTDPLNDEDVDANGDPVFHRIPMNVSTDLVNWTYVGDAFPLDGGDIPDWIDPQCRLLGARGRLLQRHRPVLPLRHRHRDHGRRRRLATRCTR